MERALLRIFRIHADASVQRPAKNIFATLLFGLVWIAAVAFGLRGLFNYESKPGRVGPIAQTWQSGLIKLASDRPTLVMIAHPRCPCTQASVGELAELMARVQGKVAAYVLFVIPKGAGAEWDNTSLRRRAATIPGVTVLSDVDGVEARRFGAETSGHTLLFGSDGRLLFTGGITATRGHAGENAGENAIIALVRNDRPARHDSLVFGCALADQRSAASESEKLR
jgi:hypothetical protein